MEPNLTFFHFCQVRLKVTKRRYLVEVLKLQKGCKLKNSLELIDNLFDSASNDFTSQTKVNLYIVRYFDV
jgi:hypothetical protein